MNTAIKTGLLAGLASGIVVTILNLIFDFYAWVGIAVGVVFFITFYFLEKLFGLYEKLSK